MKARHAKGPAASSTTPQRDEATGASATGQDERYRDMKLPHERDESATPDANAQDPRGDRAVVRQGARDVEAGREDTDCYNANSPRYRKREGKLP